MVERSSIVEQELLLVVVVANFTIDCLPARKGISISISRSRFWARFYFFPRTTTELPSNLANLYTLTAASKSAPKAFNSESNSPSALLPKLQIQLRSQLRPSKPLMDLLGVRCDALHSFVIIFGTYETMTCQQASFSVLKLRLRNS